MSKTAYTDGCWVVMHFNSSVQAYYANRDLGPYYIECCYCHNKNQVTIPQAPGQNKKIRCGYCGKQCEYTTVILTEPLARFFNVRGGTIDGSPLGIGSVMHVVLPEHHQEFDSIISAAKLYGIPRETHIEDDWPILDIVRLVMEDGRGYFAMKVSEIRRVEGTFINYRHIPALSQGFENFGEIVRMHRIDYSDGQLKQSEELYKEIFIETMMYLVGIFNKNITEDQISDINLNLIKYCHDYIKTNYGKKILAIMNS